MLVMRASRVSSRALFIGLKPAILPVAMQEISFGTIQIRNYSSSRYACKEKDSPASSMSDKLKEMRPQVRAGATVVGGGVVLYGISRLFFDVASSFMGLTPALSLKYGFVFGLVSGGTMAGLTIAADRAMRARPDLAYQMSMALVRNSDDVNALLGSAVKYSSETIHRVKSEGGSFGVVNGRATWKAPRVALVYSPPSPSSEHRVRVVCITSQPFFGKPVVEFCGVDVRSGSGSGSAGASRRLVLKDKGQGTADIAQEAANWAVMADLGAAL